MLLDSRLDGTAEQKNIRRLFGMVIDNQHTCDGWDIVDDVFNDEWHMKTIRRRVIRTP